MSFFRFRSKIVNQLRQPAGRQRRAPLVDQTSSAEPALFFNVFQKFASVREIPPAPIARLPIQPAARFPTLRRVMSRVILNRGGK